MLGEDPCTLQHSSHEAPPDPARVHGRVDHHRGDRSDRIALAEKAEADGLAIGFCNNTGWTHIPICRGPTPLPVKAERDSSTRVPVPLPQEPAPMFWAAIQRPSSLSM